MRSTFFPFSFLVLALAGGLAGAACSSSGASKFTSQERAGDEEGTSGGGSTSYNASDAGTSAPERKSLTSPLCGLVQGAGCFPDDDGRTSLFDGPTTCVEPLDGGQVEVDASAKTSGCRITNAQDGGANVYAPDCRKDDADRRGTDGVYCKSGSDCAPGFDCVDGEMGSVCRHYCCSGSCETQSSHNGGPTFCDIQKLVDFSDHKAPVCMPLKTCKLLRDGECGVKETCAVVTEKGDTGCVPKGDAKVGDPCDEDHCDSGLTCLGSPGDRRCYRLCRIEGSDCASMQTCTTGSVFQDKTFGVCKDD